MIPATIRELYTWVDEARTRLLDAATDDAALDHPFEMGEGSARKTLHHLWGAEKVWLARWKQERSPLEAADAETGDKISIATLRDRFAQTAAEREAWLANQSDETFKQTFSYGRPFWMEPGPPLEIELGVTVLQVLNHFAHHGAQAVNMLRRAGAQAPRIDYIVLRGRETPAFDLPTLRRYLAHSDWAWREVHKAAAPLSDDDRRRAFDIGPGSLQRIMRHLADAPAWWVANLEGRHVPFPAIREDDPWDDLWSAYQNAARLRDHVLDRNPDLQTPIEVHPRPEKSIHFALGVAMLQLCIHSTWHRAQALNMLRHCGAEVPSLDVNVWHRAGAPLVVA